ncbi:hypothetical protein [Euzebya sp.]|uniref:hypothetical protein n=1 Tax=Euzebya sp. TaxID=1971409 RepID=UPI0035153B09
MTRHRRQLAVLALSVIAASACGPTGDVTAWGGVTTQRIPADTIDVGLTDFAIATSAVRLVEGTVTLDVTNAGATAHDLRIAGATTDVRTSVLQPGDITTITVETSGEDTLTLWCTLPGHRQQGMETTMSVGS